MRATRGHLCAFGARRNLHRLIVAIKEAGLEYCDLLMWIYGNGMPKSRNIGRAVNAHMIMRMNGQAGKQP